MNASTDFGDDCPITGQPHRYFIYKTFETYEAYKGVYDALPFNGQLYEKKEIAILGCNCGSVIKQEVQNVKNV